MPSYALKPGRVLQLRKDFADERENHVLSVYSERLNRDISLTIQVTPDISPDFPAYAMGNSEIPVSL